jgi:hypothetical protein
MKALGLLCSLRIIVVCVHSLFLSKQNLMHLLVISYCSCVCMNPLVEEKYRNLSKMFPSLPQTRGLGWIHGKKDPLKKCSDIGSSVYEN